MRGPKVLLAPDCAVHRKIVRISREEFLDSVPAESPDEKIEEPASQDSDRLGSGDDTLTYDAGCGSAASEGRPRLALPVGRESLA